MRYIVPDPIDSLTADKINTVVRGSHRSLLKVWTADYSPSVWRRHPLLDEAGWSEPTFRVLNGTVSERMNDPITRELSMSIASDYWDDPLDALPEVSPYKTLIAVARGVEGAVGIVGGVSMTELYYVPLGVYRVRSVRTAGNADTGYEVSVSGFSMEADIREARFLTMPIAGTSTGQIGANQMRDVIKKLVDGAFPKAGSVSGYLVPFQILDEGSGLGYNFPSGTMLTEERDRLDLILKMMDSRNVWGRFDRTNLYVISTIPSTTDTPIDFVVDGGPDGVLISYGKEFGREMVYNAVLAFGEFGEGDALGQASYLAIDDDPTSPTYWDGAYGRVPRFQQVGFLPDDPVEAAVIVQAAAESTLSKSRDFDSGINFASVPNPLLEVGDVVEFEIPVGLDNPLLGGLAIEPEVIIEHHMLGTMSIGLGADVSFTADALSQDDTVPEVLAMTAVVEDE